MAERAAAPEPSGRAAAPEPSGRPAWAEVDLAALRHNVELLVRRVSPSTLCAVVKADAYGHGAVPVARAALDAGATHLAVALVEEGIELREHGVSAPVLVLSEAAPGSARALAAAGLGATVASCEGLHAIASAARAAGTQVPVHVKVDTGMHRVGVVPSDAAALVAAALDEPAVRVEGVFTHLAVADGSSADDRRFTASQLATFASVAGRLPRRPPLLHAANSAAAIAWPAARADMVRCGIAMYGLAPSAAMAASDDPEVAAFCAELRPVLSLKARVSSVRELDAGERPSYGRRRALPERAVVATVPIGYADGVRRALFDADCPVLVGGHRRPLAGVVTMDQLMVDCGPGAQVAPGEEVVLIGRQGGEEITATEWAARLGTIGYEVLCGIGARVPRVHLRAGAT